MVYEWKSGARVKADAQAVGEKLSQIRQRDARTVVAEARMSEGALHDCFEWDDTAAAEGYRLEQARLILRMLVVVEEAESEDDEPIVYRAFEAIYPKGTDKEDRNARVYVETREALSDPDMREQIMARLEKTIGEAETTADKYSNLVPSFAVVRDKLKDARETVRA